MVNKILFKSLLYIIKNVKRKNLVAGMKDTAGEVDDSNVAVLKKIISYLDGINDVRANNERSLNWRWV